MDFNVESVVSKFRSERKVRRRRRTWSKSVLLGLLSELVLLRRNGATFGDLQHWLRHEKRIKVHRSTIKRFLDKCRTSNELN